MKPIRLLAVLEANTITGPAKNLLQFAKMAPVEVSVVDFRRDGQSDLFLRTAEQAGVAVYPIPERGRFDRSVISALVSLSGKLAPDIVQTHAVKSHFLIRRAGLHHQFPWIAFHHGYTWPDLRARVYNQVDRWSLRAARRVVTVSIPFRQELIRHGVPPERISIVHNAIDPDWGRSAPPIDLSIPLDRKVILTVGRLSREKDHLTLLDSVDQIRRKGSIVPHLIIVGEGPERSRIEERIRALNLASHVSMTGQVPSAEPYYRIADVAVLSSLTEGSPNALLEAMATRVPVVATAVGGIPEIVQNRDSALLVPPRDCAAMAQSITALLTNPALAHQLTTRAHDLVETAYSPQTRAATLTTLYRALLTPDSAFFASVPD